MAAVPPPRPRPRLVLVAAVARDGGLGRDGELLFRIPADLKRFKALTLGHPVVMGRKTWESIGRPLPGRRNVVVSRNPAFAAEGAEVVPSFEAALDATRDAAQVAVIGGASVYAAALPLADVLELTEIDAVAPADVRFPDWDRRAWVRSDAEPAATPDGVAYRFVTWRRRPA
jgi:dihydrofolate reductase